MLVFLAERPLAHPVVAAFCRGGWWSWGFPSLGLCEQPQLTWVPRPQQQAFGGLLLLACSRDGRAPAAFPLGEVWDFLDLARIPSFCLSLQLIDRATSPRDEGDPKAEQKTLEESWQDLALIKATQKPPKRQRREDLSEPLLSPAPPPAPGDARGERAVGAPGCTGEDHLDVLGQAAPVLPAAWEHRVIFSSVVGKLTRLCLPPWEAPEPRPLFWQCLRSSQPGRLSQPVAAEAALALFPVEQCLVFGSALSREEGVLMNCCGRRLT